jgi:hypothetical protein
MAVLMYLLIRFMEGLGTLTWGVGVVMVSPRILNLKEEEEKEEITLDIAF